MDENTINTKVKRPDSWSNINSSNKSFLGRKRVDYSTFQSGTTIPERFHKAFLSNLSTEIAKGKQIKIRLFIDNREYKVI